MVNPDTSAIDLSRAIHLKQVSCQEVMLSTLDRIAQLNPQSNAIVSLQEPELLLAQARERDAQLARGESMGWMHGMPQAIKDLANAQGLRTTLGSPLMKDFVASEDGLMARCLQHEVDHLNGVLFIDHISRLKRDIVVRKFRKLAKDKVGPLVG